jgi:hypothetical protein
MQAEGKADSIFVFFIADRLPILRRPFATRRLNFTPEAQSVEQYQLFSW